MVYCTKEIIDIVIKLFTRKYLEEYIDLGITTLFEIGLLKFNIGFQMKLNHYCLTTKKVDSKSLFHTRCDFHEILSV